MNKVLLCILDGFGYGPEEEGNAILNAKTPCLDATFAQYPWTLLEASGEAVGIPAGTQGGSEVGHLTMGAGRVVPQPLLTINRSIESREFFQKPLLLEAAAHAKNAAFHIVGMLSDQGVHADIRHAMALLDFAKEQGLTRVYLHGITDGRDVQPQTARFFVSQIQNYMEEIGVGQLATLIGRYFAMDRDKNLIRTQKAYDLMTQGLGKACTDPLTAIEAAYAQGLESDYYLEPLLIQKEGLIHAEDTVVFFNFRTDRAAQLTEQIITQLHPHFLAFGPYTTQAPVLFPATEIKNNLGAVLEANGLKQLRIAETEKYAHVTFFFNSQVKDPFPHEDRILVDSPKTPSYADQPEMSAPAITQKLLEALPKDYAFIALNFANLDLVGHSGDYAATVKAVESIDACLAQILPLALENDYTIFLTGDHGNAEHMLEAGEPCPSHTRNPVPLLVISNPQVELVSSSHVKSTAGLKDLAPSILARMGIPIPVEMTGQNLIKDQPAS